MVLLAPFFSALEEAEMGIKLKKQKSTGGKTIELGRNSTCDFHVRIVISMIWGGTTMSVGRTFFL